MRSGWLRHHVSEANPERTALAVPALTPGASLAHVVALRSTTRLLLPGALGFLPYRGDLSAIRGM